jgi:hypothetical protein
MDGELMATDDKPAPKPKADAKYPGDLDEVAFLAEARERFQEAVDFDRLNRDAGLEDLRFIAGEQWDPTEKAKRKKAGLPSLTINTLPQFVGQVIGDLRINKPAIKVRPAEDGDKDVAEVRAGLIRAIEHASDASGVYIASGEDQVGCGIGNFRVNLEWVDDDVFDQDIRFRAISNPFAVAWDPMSTERTGRDARYCFVIDEAPRKPFEKQYPDVVMGDLEIPGTHSQGWVTKDVVRVVEYWLMKETKRTIALLNDGAIKDITDKEDEFAGQVALDEAGKPRTRVVKRKSACMYLITATAILQAPYELPIDRVPVIRVEGRVVRVGDTRFRFGLIRFAKDASRLRNYWRSTAAQLLAMQPRAQWIADEKSVEGERGDDFRAAHRSGDPLLTYKGVAGVEAPKRVDPPTFPAAIIQEANLNAQDIKDVTGLHDASLGVQSNETSGKAIMARQREGDVATFMYHDNLHAAIQEGGRIANVLIPTVYDAARTIRVIGEDETATLKRINDPNDKDAIDLGKGKYDVVIETGPSYSTKRVEAAESMMQFVQAVPQAAAVAGDLIAQAQDWPLATEIGDRLKKTLPPGIAEEKDDKDLTPEEAQAKQAAAQQAQQGQQMQQQAQQMALAKTAAETKQAEADARKAQADALKAEAEAVKANLDVMTSQAGKIMDQVFGPQAAQFFMEAFQHAGAQQVAAANAPDASSQPPPAQPGPQQAPAQAA